MDQLAEFETRQLEFHRLKDNLMEEMYQFGKMLDEFKMLGETNVTCLNTVIEKVNTSAHNSLTTMQEFRHIFELKATISRIEDTIIDKNKK